MMSPPRKASGRAVSGLGAITAPQPDAHSRLASVKGSRQVTTVGHASLIGPEEDLMIVGETGSALQARRDLSKRDIDLVIPITYDNPTFEASSK